MSAGLWSGVHYNIKTDPRLRLLHRFERGGLVPAICFAQENQVHKTELRLKNVRYGEHLWSHAWWGRPAFPGKNHAYCGRCLFLTSHPFFLSCVTVLNNA